MAQTVCIILSSEDRLRLAAVIQDRNSPQKHVQRAKIVLHSAERRSVLDVARVSGASRPAVWRWQRRYAEEGVEGLLRDKTRKPGKAPLPAKTGAKVLALPCSEPRNPTIPPSRKKSRMWSAFIWIRLVMRWCCRSTRKARFRRSTAHSRACR